MADPGLFGTLSNGIQAGVDLGKAIADGIANIGQPESRPQGEHKSKEKRKYDYTFKQYPGDLDSKSSRHPYWMTFYINKQELSTFRNESSEQIFDKKTDKAIRSVAQINASLGNNLQKNFGKSNTFGFGRKTQRTAVAIRLFMPDSLNWSYSNKFNDANLSDINGMGLLSTLTAIPPLYRSSTEAAKKGGTAGVLASLQSPQARNAAGVGAELTDQLSGMEKGFGASVLGIAVNPQVDVIYVSPELRQFTFDFLFSPQTEKEAVDIAEIIHLFKFHSAPEMLGGGIGIGRYYVPPAEFDIEFSVNTMGKISTCVLQNITLDYTPSGTAFYDNKKSAGTHHPVNTRMTLQFRELEFMTKELIDRGF
jgi:hypothetical protein